MPLWVPGTATRPLRAFLRGCTARTVTPTPSPQSRHHAEWALTSAEWSQHMRCVNGNRPRRGERRSQIDDSNLVLSISNVTSATTHAAQIAELALDGVHIIVETDLNDVRCRRMREELRRLSPYAPYSMVTGHVPNNPGGYKRGVAIVAGPRYAANIFRVPIPPSARAAEWEREGRIAMFGCTMQAARRHPSDSGKFVLYLVCVYAPVEGEGFRTQVLNAAEELVALAGDSPVMVAGDLNTTVDRNPVLQRWNETGCLRDLHMEWSAVRGTQPGPTTHHANRQGRRLDYVWANPSAFGLVSDFNVRPDLFPTHHTLVATVIARPMHHDGWRRFQPPALDLTARREATPETLAIIQQRGWAEWEGCKEQALLPQVSRQAKRAAISRMFEIWSAWAEDLLRYRAGCVVSGPHYRGKVQPIRPIPGAQPQTASQVCGAAATRTMAATRLSKCIRKVEVLQRMPLYNPGGQRERTWANLQRAIQVALADCGWAWARHTDAPPPTHNELVELKKELETARLTEQRRRERKTLARWRRKMRTDQVFEWLRSKPEAPQSSLNVAKAGAEPRYTTCPQEIDAAVRTLWGKIGAPGEAPDDNAVQVLMNAVPERHAQPEQPLTGEDVQKALKGAKGCRGPDGWSPAELRAAEELHPTLADFYNTMEIAGVVPEVFLQCDTTLIPKRQGSQAAQDMRPIAVLATGYRTWSSARFKSTISPWQEDLYGDAPLAGGRTKWGCRDLTLPLAVTGAVAAAQGRELHGAAYDLEKAFDTLPCCGDDALMWKIARRAAFPPLTMGLMQDVYSSAQRRFKFAGRLGTPQPLAPLRGVVQGCALSAAAMVLTTYHWWRMLQGGLGDGQQTAVTVERLCNQAVSPEAASAAALDACRPANASLLAGGYLDDMHVASESLAEVRRAHVITVLWAHALGVRLSPGKCVAWGSAHLRVAGQEMRREQDIELLGEVVVRKEPENAEVLKKRVEACRDRLKKIACLPGGTKRRLQLAQQCAVSKLYGWDVTPLSTAQKHALRRQTWSAATAGRHIEATTALEIVFTVATKGHLVDAVQAPEYACVRLLAKRWRQAAPWCVSLDAMIQNPPQGANGLLAQACAMLTGTGWEWEPGGRLRAANGVVYSLGGDKVHIQKLLHAFRDALRAREMRKLVSGVGRGTASRGPRVEYTGVENGVKWNVTRRLLAGMGQYQQGTLLRIMAGAFFPRDRMFRHHRGATTACCIAPTCRGSQIIDDATHAFWLCPYYEPLRPARMRALRQNFNAIAPCFKNCAIAVPGISAADTAATQRGMTTIALHRSHWGPSLRNPNTPPDIAGAPLPATLGEEWWGQPEHGTDDEQEDTDSEWSEVNDEGGPTALQRVRERRRRIPPPQPTHVPHIGHPPLPLHPLALWQPR